MPYQVIDPIALSPKSAAAADYAVTLADFGLSLANDDYLLLSVACSATSGTLSVSGAGWSELSELDVALGPRMAHYICKVAAGTAADPTITLSAGTGLWQVSLEQWRDVDITTGTITTDFAETPVTIDPGASVTSVTTTSSTPAADNCTIHYFGVTRNGSTTVSCRFLSDKVVGWGMQNVDDNSVFMSYGVGTVQQQTKANSQQVMYAGASCRAGVIVLYIKNKSGGKMERDCRATMTKVGWFGDYGVAHESGAALAASVGAPSTFCVWNAGTEQINGIDAATTAATMTNDIAGLAPASSKWSQFNSTENTAGKWVGGWWATPSTIDMTGKIFSIEWHIPLIGVQVGAEGVLIAFGDSATADAGNAVVFQLASKNKIAGALSYTSHIAVETAEQYAAVGSIDWASIDKIGIFYHRAGISGTARQIVFRNMFLHGSSVMVGGNSARPLDIRFLDAALNGWGYSGLCTKSGDAVLVKTSCQFGDGTIATYVDTTATLLNTPSAYSPITQPLWNVPANGITVGMKGASGDTMRFVASAMAAGAGAEQNFTIDSATSASATVSFSGEVISNFLFTGDTDAPISGATYSGCDEVAFGGAIVTNTTVTDTTSTDAAVSWSANPADDISGCTFDGSGALYAIELGSLVTAISFPNCTITAGSTDKVHVKATTGTVTITISGTTTLVAGDVTSAGATVVIAAPQPTLSATVLASSRVVLYNNTTDAELDNTAPGGTSWSKVITSGASVNDSLTLHVFKEGYQEFSTTFLYTGDDATILVTQEVDSNIASLRTELSITDYTTITEFALDVTGTVEIDADDADGSSQKARLAIWYNGILTTENGARYLRGAITILSTAAFRINTNVLDLKIENVSVTYGLNFTDTERRLYRDDGAAIYAPASAPGSIQNDYSGVPDTVETGVSGLTGSESAQLMGLPSATTIAAAVWAYVITGSTTAVQMMRGFAAVLLGKVSGAGTGTETFRDIADTTDVVVATVDSDGNRTAITRTLT